MLKSKNIINTSQSTVNYNTSVNQINTMQAQMRIQLNNLYNEQNTIIRNYNVIAQQVEKDTDTLEFQLGFLELLVSNH